VRTVSDSTIALIAGLVIAGVVIAAAAL